MGIKKLKIKNFAIIKDLSLDFSEGLNIFTGETGAGKSIIVEAAGFLFGDRAYAEMIREGENSMEVEGEFVFDTDKVKDKFPELKEKRVSLKRIFDRGGKSRAWLNSKPCPASSLAVLGSVFADFHGQNQGQSLLLPENQLSILDRYAGLEKKSAAFSELYYRRAGLENSIKNINLSREEKERLIDLYSFQSAEIEKTAPREGEDAELEELISRLKNIDKINGILSDSSALLLKDDSSALNSVHRVLVKLESLARLDSSFSEPAARLSKVKDELQDIAETFESGLNNPDYEPGKLDFYIGRHEKIKNLKKKYGETLALVLKKGEELKQRVKELEGSEHDISELNRELEKLSAEMGKAAEKLSVERAAAAKKLSRHIEEEIKDLGFEYVRFSIKAETLPDFSPFGGDRVEFLFTSNPDQFLKPLRYIASGGEISRVMLAVKSALSEYDLTEMLVFDEIDSGVGGNTIFSMGEKLRKLSSLKQVLCITHMAQLAAFGKSNFKVEKKAKSGQTEIKVFKLEGEEKAEEIARMLGSRFSAKTAEEHARQLIHNAQKNNKK